MEPIVGKCGEAVDIHLARVADLMRLLRLRLRLDLLLRLRLLQLRLRLLLLLLLLLLLMAARSSFSSTICARHDDACLVGGGRGGLSQLGVVVGGGRLDWLDRLEDATASHHALGAR